MSPGSGQEDLCPQLVPFLWEEGIPHCPSHPWAGELCHRHPLGLSAPWAKCTYSTSACTQPFLTPFCTSSPAKTSSSSSLGHLQPPRGAACALHILGNPLVPVPRSWEVPQQCLLPPTGQWEELGCPYLPRAPGSCHCQGWCPSSPSACWAAPLCSSAPRPGLKVRQSSSSAPPGLPPTASCSSSLLLSSLITGLFPAEAKGSPALVPGQRDHRAPELLC